MINLPEKYDTNDPRKLGWLALYICICRKKSSDEAMRAMGIKLYENKVNVLS